MRSTEVREDRSSRMLLGVARTSPATALGPTIPAKTSRGLCADWKHSDGLVASWGACGMAGRLDQSNMTDHKATIRAACVWQASVGGANSNVRNALEEGSAAPR